MSQHSRLFAFLLSMDNMPHVDFPHQNQQKVRQSRCPNTLKNNPS
jgi:hypothetical protein